MLLVIGLPLALLAAFLLGALFSAWWVSGRTYGFRAVRGRRPGSFDALVEKIHDHYSHADDAEDEDEAHEPRRQEGVADDETCRIPRLDSSPRGGRRDLGRSFSEPHTDGPATLRPDFYASAADDTERFTLPAGLRKFREGPHACWTPPSE